VCVCVCRIQNKINLFIQSLMRRASLNPPPESNITWDEYVVAPPGQCPLLGRNLVYKESSKTFKATVAYCGNESRFSPHRRYATQCFGSHHAI